MAEEEAAAAAARRKRPEGFIGGVVVGGMSDVGVDVVVGCVE